MVGREAGVGGSTQRNACYPSKLEGSCGGELGSSPPGDVPHLWAARAQQGHVPAARQSAPRASWQGDKGTDAAPCSERPIPAPYAREAR